MKARLPLKIGPGQVLTAAKADALRALGRAGDGGLAATVAHTGGTLAMLRQFGLAELAGAADALGERRTRITARGREVLARLGFEATS